MHPMPVSEFAEHARLHSQFVISKDPVAPSYRALEIGPWRVGFGDGFSQTKILDSLGAPIGIFLGAVTDFSSRTFKPASITLPWATGSDRESWKIVFTSVRDHGSPSLPPTDCNRSIWMRAVQSRWYSLKINPWRRHRPAWFWKNKEYFGDLYDEARSETWSKLDRYHTAGLTAHRSLNRLLPNHRLNLESWAVERIWPRTPFPSLGIDQVISEIVDDSRGSIDIAMQGGNTLMPLTAGNETRALWRSRRAGKAA